jgi:hypothetical protein
MKKSFIYILLIGALISNDRILAGRTSFKERTEQWLQQAEKNPGMLQAPGGGGWIPGDTDPGGDNGVKDPEKEDVPIHDFLPLLVGFSLIYVLYIFDKKKKRV